MVKHALLKPLEHFLEIPSISTQDQYLPEMEHARHFLQDILGFMGFEVLELKGEKHNAIFAQKITNPKNPTVLIYGHYDVQPPDPLDQWLTPPFSPTIKDGKIYARGTVDNKGQLLINILAVQHLINKNPHFPLNFKFIIEGEEEIGSISVNKIVHEHKKLLKADFIIVSDSEMLGPNQPTIDISLRGLLYTEITIETAAQDLHSGQFGGIAANPAIILARILTQLKDHHNRILIPKFYDNVVSPTKKEIRDYQKIPYTTKDALRDGKLFLIGGGEPWYSLNERRWARPTLDVNGIVSGYIEEGSKTIIPAKASAKISMRLVPNQHPDVIYHEFVKFIRKLIPTGTKLTVVKHASALPYKAPTDHPVFDLIKKSLHQHFGREPIFTGVGGSIGFIPIIAQVLKVPVIMVGFGLPDSNLHSPNEHLLLDNYFKGIATMTDFYNSLADFDI